MFHLNRQANKQLGVFQSGSATARSPLSACVSLFNNQESFFSTSSQSSAAVFDKILVANRGEIACRVIRSAADLGVRTVAVYSEADANSRHVQMADEAYLVGPPPAAESYLLGDRIIDVALKTGAQAIHPGYGFLSENAGFADACANNGIVFIGPPSSAIESMGSKSESKKIMEAANVPCVPGYHGEDQDEQLLADEAEKIGYPVLIKAVMGGGGKGMRIVNEASEFQEALDSAKRESMSSFGDDRVLVEKYLRVPRHIEIQVFADGQGDAVYLFERDCSVQRRYQKVIEEAPGPGITPEVRQRMGESAVAAAKAVGYCGAGTVEFIMDEEDQSYYFMEMNTRLQVEHPVTEMVTGEDLVQWQLHVASGNPLPKKQDELTLSNHAFEARIYAENPDNNFLPGTGTLRTMLTPEENEDVRVDTGVRQGDDVSIFYDPMIAKLIVRGKDRNAALKKMKKALDEFKVVGLPTNIDFLGRVCSNPAFIEGGVTTNFIPEQWDDLLPPVQKADGISLALAAVGGALKSQQEGLASVAGTSNASNPFMIGDGKRLNGQDKLTVTFQDGEDLVSGSLSYNGSDFGVSFDGAEFERIRATLNGNVLKAEFDDGHRVTASYIDDTDEVQVSLVGSHKTTKLQKPVPEYLKGGASAKGSLVSPMPGKVTKIMVEAGQTVKKGDPLLVMEAMKMEHTIKAPADGVVGELLYNEGDQVKESVNLVRLEVEDEE